MTRTEKSAAASVNGTTAKPRSSANGTQALRAHRNLEFSATFWGVRGSIAVPGEKTARYGGNTPCVEVRCGEHLLIFDAGTGIRVLGDLVSETKPPLDFDIFLSHTHIDHLNGLPFFGPAFEAQNALRIWAGHLLPDRTIKNVLDSMMADPLFPIPVEALLADIAFIDFHVGETLNPHRGVVLKTAPLNHPNRATGYRVEFSGKAICYVTDTEQFADRLDENILGLIEGADYVIYDAMYTSQEYGRHKGWGHSTWEEGVRLVEAAGARTLVLLHHMPSRTDDDLDGIQKTIDAIRPGTLIAREGMTLSI